MIPRCALSRASLTFYNLPWQVGVLLSDKGVTSAAKRVDPVRSQTGMSREEVIARLIGTFKALHGGTDGAISPEEMAAAETLAAEKFETEEWLRHVP